MHFDLKHKMEGHSGAVYVLLADKHSDLLFSGGADGLVASWDVRSGLPMPFMVKVGKAVFSLHKLNNHLLIGDALGGIHVVDVVAKSEIRHLKFHRNGLFAMAAIPLKGLLLSAGGDGVLAITEVNEYRHLRSIEVSTSKLRCISISKDQLWAVVGGSDGYLRFFDTAYFNEVHCVKAHEGGVYSTCQLSANTWVSGGRDAHLRFWKVTEAGPEQTSAIPAHNFAIYSLSLSDDGLHLASGSRDKTVKIWNLNDFTMPLRLSRPHKEGHTHSVNSVLYLPHSDVWVSAGDDRKILVWEASVE